MKLLLPRSKEDSWYDPIRNFPWQFLGTLVSVPYEMFMKHINGFRKTY